MEDFNMQTVTNECDFYMEIFKRLHWKDPKPSLTHKVIHLYDHYRDLKINYLGYSATIQLNLWKFIQTAPSKEEVIQWFETHVFPIQNTRYGWTNGKMDWYTGGCFAENTKIRMADQSLKEIQYLQKDDLVWNPITEKSCKVVCMVKWKQPVDCIRVPYSDLYITPYHPILNDTHHWIFPISLYSHDTNIQYTQQNIYNMVLDSGHIIEADNVYTCTFGHEFTSNNVIKHPFFGTSKVIESLQKISIDDWNNGSITVSCAVRDADTGLVVEFI